MDRTLALALLKFEPNSNPIPAEIKKRRGLLAKEWQNAARPSEELRRINDAYDFLLGKPETPKQVGPSVLIQRELERIRTMIRVVDSRVKSMREDDPRIAKMYAPLKEREGQLLRDLSKVMV